MPTNKKESVEIHKAKQARVLAQQPYCIGTELCSQLDWVGVTALPL